MTKYEISERLLEILEYDAEELPNAILELANEIKEDYYASIEEKCYCCD